MVVDGARLSERLYGQPCDMSSYLAGFGHAAPALAEVADVAPLWVEVNHGIWIWRCPCTDGDREAVIRGGGVAFVASPYGWCPECGNAAVGGRWRPLRFPDERVEIELALAVRPDPETRNWWPGETVADLERENADHADEVTQ